MLKAGSLLYAIFIALLVSSTAFTFLLWLHFQRLHVAQQEGRIRAISQLESGMAWAKANTTAPPIALKLDVFNEALPPVDVRLQAWGLFSWATASCYFKQDTFRKAALLGYKRKRDFALYLVNNRQPLSLSGDARLSGKVYLSEGGLKRAYIEGRSYSGKELLKGTVEESEAQLPKMDAVVQENIISLLKEGVPPTADTVFEAAESELLHRSFYKTTACLYTTGKLQIRQKQLSGKVIIKSEKGIEVGAEATLDGVLLVAPTIKIAAGFKGRVQLIAADTILLGEGCQLLYPSALALYDENEDNVAAIKMEKGCSLTGEILMMGKNAKFTKGFIQIEEGVTVKGHIYAANKIELKGEVLGSITADKFSLKTSSSIYENHLLDGEINEHALPGEYVGSGFLPAWSNQTKEIVQWLN